MTAAETFGELLAPTRFTVATAESMTGGALGEALVAVEGSSEWLAGGVIAYQSRVKYDVLGVRPGPVVSASAAREMALGAARLLRTDVAIATTGCAGPAPMEDQPVGTLWVGVAVRSDAAAQHFLLDGGPATIRERAVDAALRFAAERIGAFARS